MNSSKYQKYFSTDGFWLEIEKGRQKGRQSKSFTADCSLLRLRKSENTAKSKSSNLRRAGLSHFAAGSRARLAAYCWVCG